MTNVLSTAPVYMRAGAPASKDIQIDPKGGYRKQGIIRDVSVMQTGEALGHNMWIDKAMLQQTVDAINEMEKGAKSRFTHPSMSGDGLGKTVGRVRDAKVVDNKAVADQHFIEAGHKAPDGDLAGYLMSLADEDSAAYGLSIVFALDRDEMRAFEDANTTKKYGFVSPDPDNENNYPHARLSELRAVDAVDEPAANPDGLFHREKDIVVEAEAMAAYALGFEKNIPKHASLGLDPDRVRGFVSRFLKTNNLEVVKMADENTPDAPEEEFTKPAEEKTEEKTEDKTDETPEKDADSSAPAAAASERSESKRFADAFGDQGAIWFAEGLSFEQAGSKMDSLRDARIEKLEKQLAAGVSLDGEDSPIGADLDEEKKDRGGFASKIKFK